MLKQGNPVILTAILATIAVPFWAPRLFAGVESKAAEALPTDIEIGDRITATELQRLYNLREYEVVRKYKLCNPHLKQDAVMTVRLMYQKGIGKSFEVVDIKNAEGMSRSVLQKLIDSEAESSRRPSQDELQVSTANYKFHVSGTGIHNSRRCYIVELIPKRKSKYLIQGYAWVDANEFALLRVQGRPSANLSFWVGKPEIVQDFEKVGQFWMAAHNRSESHSTILGSSVLTIDYFDYQVTPETRIAQADVASKTGTPP
jgi:hypothetical protein